MSKGRVAVQSSKRTSAVAIFCTASSRGSMPGFSLTTTRAVHIVPVHRMATAGNTVSSLRNGVAFGPATKGPADCALCNSRIGGSAVFPINGDISPSGDKIGQMAQKWRNLKEECVFSEAKPRGKRVATVAGKGVQKQAAELAASQGSQIFARGFAARLQFKAQQGLLTAQRLNHAISRHHGLTI